MPATTHAVPSQPDLLTKIFERPIFLAGRGRSGTSLLMRLFDGHPQVFSTPGETQVFTEIAPQLKKTGDRTAAAEAVARQFPAPHRDVDPALVEAMAALDLDDPALPRALLRLGMERWGPHRAPGQAVAFLEKTPKNEEHLPALFAAFPSAKVLYLLRDPRAVYISNSRSPVYRREPTFTAQQWVKSVRRILALVGSKEGEAIRVIRFEDLVADPRATLEPVCAFLGLDWSEALTTPTANGKIWTGNAYDPDKLTPHGVASAKADEWREEITREDKAAIEAEAGFVMSLLGYGA